LLGDQGGVFMDMRSGMVFVCEDVSKIERRGELFYLTDVCGDVTITRAMEWPIFAKCVRGAMELVRQFEAGDNVVELRATK